MPIRLDPTSIQTIASTELNSLANGSGIDGAAYDNSSGLFIWAGFELQVTFGTNPTAGNLVQLYMIPALDGTNYTDFVTGASPYAPFTTYVGGFPVRAVTSAQRISLGGGLTLVHLLPVPYQPFVVNQAGFAFPSSGSVLRMLPYAYEQT